MCRQRMAASTRSPTALDLVASLQWLVPAGSRWRVRLMRRDRALTLLRSSLSLGTVASRLGYSDLANFTRAFRRWTGTTPGAYRRNP